ncbi:hypothetical protein J1605_010059 [Eschrichtius robustus]|uniref:Uncharacterized protein n=1 Tax=Eschrichtius robustus TaxID=9764 RepID=A0AB34GVM0_ESCRO|nr:hypothetical protein J1605_010059 [Eschrichtius robustus]
MNGRGGAGARRRARAAPAPPPPRSAWPPGQGRSEGRVLAATWGGAAGAPIGRPVWPTGRSARADWSARAGGILRRRRRRRRRLLLREGTRGEARPERQTALSAAG